MAGKDDPERRGVIPNAFEHIFNHIARSQDEVGVSANTTLAHCSTDLLNFVLSLP